MSNIFDKISHFIPDQLPDFVQSDHQTFVKFLEAYFEWLELPDNPVNVSRQHLDNIDIDKTVDQFIEFFRNKYLVDIPQDVLADKALLAKNIRDFYSARGSEKSYELLFRILFNDEIDFYYPKTDLLRPSDGKWVEEFLLFAKKLDSTNTTQNAIVNPFFLEQQRITGQETGSTALVDIVRLVNEGPLKSYQLVLQDFDGQFKIGERITATLLDGTVIESELRGFVSSFEVTEPGLNYQVGDLVPVEDATGNGFNAIGRISRTFDPQSITDIEIFDGGTGYRVGDPVIFDESQTQGFGAIAQVSALNNTTTESVISTIIADVQNDKIQPDENTAIEDFVDFVSITKGTIIDFDIIDRGQNYDTLPTATVGQQQPSFNIPPGTGAVIQPRSNANGAVREIEVENPGVGYVENNKWPQADLTQTGNGLAEADVNVSGGPFVSDGKYINFDGHLSSIKVLQDSFFWQTFSYVIRAENTIDQYRDIVKQILHPAGWELFGEVSLLTQVDSNVKLVGVEYPDIRSEYTVDFTHIFDVSATVTAEAQRDYEVNFLRHKANVMEWPVIIHPYVNEKIETFENRTLEDFRGIKYGLFPAYPIFDGERTTFNRSAIIDFV